MKILVHDKNAEVTDDERRYCELKLSRLAKLVQEPTVLEAHFEKQRGLITLHVTLTHPYEKLPDHYDEVGHGCDEVVDLVFKRIKKHLERRHERS